jgi:hypothetical protein
MSYLLAFPPSTLPTNIRSPPYIIFGLNGASIVQHLPARIPLNAVLHLAPKLAQWLLPPPLDLPEAAAQDELHNGPYVGINIRADISVAGLQRIIIKIMDTAGFSVPKHLFQYKPSLITSVSIRRTWLLLDLPSAGLDGLHIHMQTLVITGPPVTLDEMKALWDTFPSDSEILHVVAVVFVRLHILLCYSQVDFEAIRRWYKAIAERFKVFKKAEDMFPDFGKPSNLRFSRTRRNKFNKNTLERRRKARESCNDADMESLEAQRDMERSVRRRRSKKKESKMSAKEVEVKVDEYIEAVVPYAKTMGRRLGSDLKEAVIMSAQLSKASSKFQREQESRNTPSER